LDDIAVYGITLKNLGLLGDSKSCLVVFDIARKRGITPNLGLYHAVILVCLNEGFHRKANHLFREFIKDKIVPSTKTYVYLSILAAKFETEHRTGKRNQTRIE